MKAKYLVRLDDACPTMHREKWEKMEELLDAYAVKPIVAVIPLNEDPKQHYGDEDPNFWKHVLTWKEKGWEIALHGCTHQYITNGGALCQRTIKANLLDCRW